MSGLRSYERDVAPLTAGGDQALRPPSETELLALVREHLARPGAPQPTVARWVYARWKPATSLTAGFELEYADGERRWVSWKRYADEKATDLAERREHKVAPEAADTRLCEHAVLAADRAHLWAPPFDRELPGLERASDLRRAKRWFLEQGLFPGRAVRSGSSCATLLRYKPERRAVLRLDLRLRPTDGGTKSSQTLAARALPVEEAARIAQARHLWQQDQSAELGPRLLAYEPRVGLLFEGWLEIDGSGPDAFDFAREAGALLARMHVEAPPQAPPSPPRDLAASLALLATQPQLRAGAQAVDATRGPRVGHTWIHGDLHPDQVARVHSGGTLRLLDLDRLGAGDAIDDLASWIADHLAERPDDGFAGAATELLDGYASAGGKLPRHVELVGAVAEALVHRAAAALRRIESGALAKAARLLELEREIAPRGARSA